MKLRTHLKRRQFVRHLSIGIAGLNVFSLSVRSYAEEQEIMPAETIVEKDLDTLLTDSHVDDPVLGFPGYSEPIPYSAIKSEVTTASIDGQIPAVDETLYWL